MIFVLHIVVTIIITPPHFYHKIYFDWLVPPTLCSTYKIVPAPLVIAMYIFNILYKIHNQVSLIRTSKKYYIDTKEIAKMQLILYYYNNYCINNNY